MKLPVTYLGNISHESPVISVEVFPHLISRV